MGFDVFNDDDILQGDELIEHMNAFYKELRKLGIDPERFWLHNLDPFKPRRKSELEAILRRLKELKRFAQLWRNGKSEIKANRPWR